jgi:hypothetical protein
VRFKPAAWKFACRSVIDVSSKPHDFIRDVEPFHNVAACEPATAQQGAGVRSAPRYDPMYDYRALVDDVSAGGSIGRIFRQPDAETHARRAP